VVVVIVVALVVHVFTGCFNTAIAIMTMVTTNFTNISTVVQLFS